MDSDIPARDHTVNGSKCLTEDDVRAYLTAEGYAAEAEAMITGALKFPEIYRYTGDRHRYLAHVLLRDGAWCWRAGDCAESEERIKALGRGRRAGLALGAFTAEDGTGTKPAGRSFQTK
jgi:hypothetical protein